MSDDHAEIDADEGESRVVNDSDPAGEYEASYVVSEGQPPIKLPEENSAGERDD